jgi:preprotein translocase subunit SecA
MDRQGIVRHQVVNELVLQYIPPSAYAEQWNTEELKTEVQRIFDLDLPVDAWAAEEGIADQEIIERLLREVDEKAHAKEAQFGPETMRQIEKMVLLQNIDHLWREHLITLEHLRQVIGFRSYGQRDPLNEYKSEGFVLFEALLTSLREAVTGTLMHIRSVPEEEEELTEVELPPMHAHHVDPFTGEDELAMADAVLAAEGRPGALLAERRAPVQTRRSGLALDPKDPATWGKVARNQLCPCGSGKKYKHCHGRHD